MKDKATLAVGYSYYNDVNSIKRSIPSFVDNVDFVFAIDGRYSLREGPDYSTDGSTEYLESFPNIIVRKFVGMEHDKRNQYLELAEEFEVDFLLIIDSDEYVKEADWDLFRAELLRIRSRDANIYCIETYYNETDTTPYPRLWFRPEQIKYYKTHNIFNVNGSLLKSSPDWELVKGIKLAADDNLRDESYLKGTYEYQKKMIEYELPFRHALRDGKQF